MTARRARWRMASSASPAALLWAVSATNSKASGERPTRSSVLAPIEPVAPSTVRRRTAGRGRAACCSAGKAARRPMALTSFSPPSCAKEQGARGGLMVERKPDEGGADGHGNDAVEPVHEAAVAGDEAARVLDAVAALQGRLGEIASLRNEPECEREGGQEQRRSADRQGEHHGAENGGPDAAEKPRPCLVR